MKFVNELHASASFSNSFRRLDEARNFALAIPSRLHYSICGCGVSFYVLVLCTAALSTPKANSLTQTKRIVTKGAESMFHTVNYRENFALSSTSFAFCSVCVDILTHRLSCGHLTFVVFCSFVFMSSLSLFTWSLLSCHALFSVSCQDIQHIIGANVIRHRCVFVCGQQANDQLCGVSC